MPISEANCILRNWLVCTKWLIVAINVLLHLSECCVFWSVIVRASSNCGYLLLLEYWTNPMENRLQCLNIFVNIVAFSVSMLIGFQSVSKIWSG